MQVNRTLSPFRPTSPYSSPEAQYPLHPSLPTGPAKVGPGSITYTTTTGPDGRIIYEPYKAVAASYQTPNGVVSGIQWIKVDAAFSPAHGQQPYIPATAASWSPDAYSPDNDWPRSEDSWQKREMKAEKLRKRELESSSYRDPDYELRMARERDAQSTTGRDRRKSFSGSQGAPVAFPTLTGSTYPTHPTQVGGYPPNPYGAYALPPGPAYPSVTDSHGRSRSASGVGYGELTEQFGNMGVEYQKDYERDRKTSSTKRSHKYNSESYERKRTVSGNYPDRNVYHPASSAYPMAPEPFLNAQAQYAASSYVTKSPNMRPGELPYGSSGVSGYPTSSSPSPVHDSSPLGNGVNIGRSTSPFGNPSMQMYPRGHILEGQPIGVSMTGSSRSRGPSRAPSPNLSYPDLSRFGKSPRIPSATIHGEPQQLPAPEAFSRPINGSNAFIPFEMMKITDMEDFYDRKMPKMPTILTSHDIYPDEWLRCMQDLGRSWTGQLPVPSFGTEGQPRRSTLAADLIDLWNTSFFFHRGVELMLYKGRERRTGPQAGYIDNRLVLDDSDSDSDDTSDSSNTSDSEGDFTHVMGPYGRQGEMADVQHARRRRREEKKETRRRRRARRKTKAREKAYTVYLGCIPRSPPVPGYANSTAVIPGGYGAASSTTVMSGGYGAATSTPVMPGGYGAATSTPVMPGGYGIASSMSGYNPSGTQGHTSLYSTPHSSSSSYGLPPMGIPKTRSLTGYGGNY